MKNSDQTTRTTQRRSFARDMHQAFVDWVKTLPLIKRDIPTDAERDILEDKSAHQDSAPQSTNGAATGRSSDSK